MKLKKILCVFLLLTLALTVLVSCDSGEENKEPYIDQALERFELEVSEETLYVGLGYTVSCDYELNNRNLEETVTYSLSENTANAVLEDRTIKASQAGSVKVTATLTINTGESKSVSRTLTFLGQTVALSMETKEFAIGNKVKLTYQVLPAELRYSNSNSLITYEIVSGDAVILNEDGNYWIVGKTAGAVQVKMTYKNTDEGVELTGEETLTFVSQSFNIGFETSDLFVGYELNLVATGEKIEGFDPSKVLWFLESGDATLEEGKIVVNSEGEVKIYATYDYNGAILKTETLTSTFTYDANVIRTADDLAKMKDSDAVFNLLADINLSSYANWTPITGFTGTLRGNGHSITGLTMTVNTLDENKGLFAVLGGTVDNLTLNGTITSGGEANGVGLLCGKNEGTIQNVKVSGSVNTEYCNKVGGLVGITENSNIVNCESTVTVRGNEYVGGIVGYFNVTRSDEVEVEGNLVNRGSVDGESHVGGVIGYLTASADLSGSGTVTVGKLTNHGAINGTADYVGGVIGRIEGELHYHYGEQLIRFIMTDCHNHAEVVGKNYVGGVVGGAHNLLDELALCSNAGNVSGQDYVGGYVGYASETKLRTLKNNSPITGRGYVGGIAGYAGRIEKCENNGTLTIEGFMIETENSTALSYVGGIAGYATNVQNCTNNAEVDAADCGYYVGGIVGYLEMARDSEAQVAGNVNTQNVTGTRYVGGLAGYAIVKEAQGTVLITVNDNKNEGTVTGSSDHVGGMFGFIAGHHYYNYGLQAADVHVKNCTNTGEITGKNYVGGIIGQGDDYVTELSLCSNTGDVSGTDFVGGFAGSAKSANVRNQTNNNSITGRGYVGGIAGRAGVLDNCKNNGTLTITGFTLGDDGTTPYSYVGGIVGYAVRVTNCENNVSIDASNGGEYVGGIVGYILAKRDSDSTISGNRNHGDVVGTKSVGGVIGAVLVEDVDNAETILVEDNKNDGTLVSGTEQVGGIVGYANGHQHYRGSVSKINIMNSTNDAEVTGESLVGGILGKGGEYVDTSDTTWRTDVFNGTVNGEGTQKYGELVGLTVTE